jgi:hypothetical protein
MVKFKKTKLSPVPKNGIRTANKMKGISIKDLLKTVSTGSFAITITEMIKVKKKI